MKCHNQKKLREEKDALGLTVPKRYYPSWWGGHGNRERIPVSKEESCLIIFSSSHEKQRITGSWTRP